MRKSQPKTMEPPQYLIDMWSKVNVMSSLTFEECQQVASVARELQRVQALGSDIESMTVELESGKQVLIKNINEMELL